MHIEAWKREIRSVKNVKQTGSNIRDLCIKNKNSTNK